MRRSVKPECLALCLGLLGSGGAVAESPSLFITLGTNAGPIADARRSQPANLLRCDGQTVLIDAGDGAAEQLAKAGLPLDAVQTIILSHHHFDHTGGLFAILGMRFQVLTPGILTIYGPPGTRQLIDGLLAAMQPMADASSASGGRAPAPPASQIKVVEVTGGSSFTLGQIAVTVAVNSHYTIKPGTPEAEKYQSLSFRFDMPDRSIVYTGDTGPSPRVEQLAQGADLLVTEIIDPDAAIAMLKKLRPEIPFYAVPFIEQHFRHEHLTADEVGLLAQRSGVKSVVVTHDGLDGEGIAKAKPLIAAHYQGPVTFAHDLDRF